MSPAQQRRAQRLAALAALRDEVGALRSSARRQHEQRARAGEARRQAVQEFIDENCRASRLDAAKRDLARRQEDTRCRREATVSFLEQRQAARWEAEQGAARRRREERVARERASVSFLRQATVECTQQWQAASEQRHDALCQIVNWVETHTGIRRRPVCPEHGGVVTESVAADGGREDLPAQARKVALRKVKGIGPKCEEILRAAGILTFEALANTSVDKLQKILRSAGSRFRAIDPSTWPEQAEFAARG